MTALFRRPFPAFRGVAIEAGHSLLVAGLAGVLIWITRPFGLATWPAATADRLIIELTTLCLLTDLVLRVGLPVLWFRHRDESRWTTGIEALRVVVELLILATVLLAWLAWRTPMSWSPGRWAITVAITGLCAIGPVLIRVLLTERHLRLRNDALLPHDEHDPRQVRASIAQSASVSDSFGPEPIRLTAEDGELELPQASLRYVHAEQNYVGVVWWIDGRRHERLLRMPLAEAERQLALSPVLRCHRSYLVRLPAIESAQGNAQGCELRLRDVPDVIPVSRSRVAALREAWKSNN
ncbi:MAG: LytTR family transcriptional regulator DNA-binding domain-containing protein [Xanthomonadales bacterium]|nr:LytTR family transcriptional regulator DNA-binding domain-containing protein [Xanthomonadales bacterium]